MDNSYLDKLNPQQRAAVEYLQGPQLVIAGAGSGKTRVLTYKIVHLLANGYEPWRIMALTFTNKAAREMRQRIQALVGEETARRLWMGTFHSIFGRLLRANADRLGFKPSFTIYDTDDSRALIKTIIRDMKLDEKVYKPAMVQAQISRVKNALISPERYRADRDLTDADRRAHVPEIPAIYATYRQRCRVAGAMDFDDLLFYTNILLKDNPDVSHHYQEFFRYVLVDEYQDTNFAQHCIVMELCRDSNNLTMVGDDAQSIYSFRGANIRNILNLKNAYPNLQIFKLEQNYRSTRNIVGVANSLIAKNTHQIRKEVFSRNDQGMPVELINSSTDFEEAYTVAARISRRRAQTGDTLEEFAVLYRTNAQSRRLEESLRKRNISYRIYGGLSFYQRKEVKDAIAYFRLSVNPDDDEALRRVINTPARGIGDTTVSKIVHAALGANVSLWQVLHHPELYPLDVNAGTRRKLQGFHDLIQGFIDLDTSGADAFQVAQTVINRSTLLSSLISDRTPESISKTENLQELLTNVREFVADNQESGSDVAPTMGAFLAEVSLATDQDEADTAQERVTLMTVHAAKGLEFNNVIIVGVEEELFPSAMSATSIEEIEEERRLLYVAITRARKFCMLSYASQRFRNGQTVPTQPSRFLHDLDPKFIQLMQGTQLGFGPDNGPTSPVDRYRASFHSPVATLGVINPSTRREPRQQPHSSWAPAPVAFTSAPAAPVTPSGCRVHALSEVKAGQNIFHDRFGRGRILEVLPDEGKITVMCSDTARTLMLKFAKFKILDA